MQDRVHQDEVKSPGKERAELAAQLARLTTRDPAEGWHVGTRLRNYFLTGLVVVGPVTITVYIAWWFINLVDAWVKPVLPSKYNPDTYAPIPIPGLGLIVAIIGLTLIGALAANLLGRTLISYGELFVARMPFVRNFYRTLRQIFHSAVTVAETTSGFQKVGLIEFPSPGIWSLVFVTGETGGEIGSIEPGGENDLLSVFMPTGIAPPTGFVCFVPRRNVIFLKMSFEDAAKIVISGGMVMPEAQERLRALAEAAQKGENPSLKP
ncbi:MAG: DUF502 domain-containing protein [Hyphomicrobiaceae bacterium]